MLEVPDHNCITLWILLLLNEVTQIREKGKEKVPEEPKNAEQMAEQMDLYLRNDEQTLVPVAPRNAEQMDVVLRNDEKALVPIAPRNLEKMDVVLRNDEKALVPIAPRNEEQVQEQMDVEPRNKEQVLDAPSIVGFLPSSNIDAKYALSIA
jgi:hypothetical protein